MSRVPLRKTVPLALVTGALAIAPAFAVKGGKAQVIDWKMAPVVDVDMTARGNLQYKGPAGKAHFNVTVHEIDEGTYDLMVNGASVATFDVGRDGNGKLRLNEKDGEMGFDPLGADMAVSKEGIVYLTASFPASFTAAHASEVDIEMNLGPTGAVPGATGLAVFESAHGQSEFEVGVSNLPDGTYDVLVGGAVKGHIAVNAEGAGDVEFGLSGHNVFLDFDPRGQLVQVAQDGNVILEGQLPTGDEEDGF